MFLLCCSIYERIQITANVRKNQFFGNLGSIQHYRQLELCNTKARAIRQLRIDHDAVACALETPVDLTEDVCPGDSDSNVE